MSQRKANPADITVYVCRSCDRNPARMETPQAEGQSFVKAVKALLKPFTHIKVKPIRCLGGCECSGTPNGCCSVGFTATGRHSYVFNQLNPKTDGWKILTFLKLYEKRPNGRIYCREHSEAEQLRSHVATRIPPP